MPDEIDAAMHAMERSVPGAPVDRIVVEPHRDQLGAGDRTALSGRDPSDFVAHGVVGSSRATFSALSADFVTRDERGRALGYVFRVPAPAPAPVPAPAPARPGSRAGLRAPITSKSLLTATSTPPSAVFQHPLAPIPDPDQSQPVRRRRRPRLRPRPPLEQRDERRQGPPPTPHLEHRPDQHPVHVTHERVGLDPELEHVGPLHPSPPVRAEHVPGEADVLGLGRGERGEVVGPHQGASARRQQPQIDPVGPVQRPPGLQRARRRPRQHPVAIRPRGRIPPGIEIRRIRQRARQHRNIPRQQRIQRPNRRRRPLVAGHLPPGVDAGVGPPGDRHAHAVSRSQNDRQGPLDLVLDRTSAALARPARESRPVVLDQQPAAHRTARITRRARPARAEPSPSSLTGAARA